MKITGICSNVLFCFVLLGCALFYIPAVHAQQDITPPEVVELSFDPTTIEDNSSSQPVTFSLHITDDSSGFQTASWHLVSPTDQKFYAVSITGSDRISGTGLDGVYAKVVDLPAGSETGTWHVARVRVADAEGNIRAYDDMPFYSSPALITHSSNLSSIFVRDFNLDNVLDICISSGTAATVYPGSANGAFGAGITTPSPSGLQGPYIGDFNGDGVPDLAFNEYPDVLGGITVVGVMFGNGNGSFQPYRVVGSMPYEVGPSVGDLDGDGKTDMAGVGSSGGDIFGGDQAFDGIVILWGRADGDFDRSELPLNYGTWRVGHILYAADVNGDSTPDIVWSKYEGTTAGKLNVMLGQGNRTFGDPIEHMDVMRAVNFTHGDYNFDGKTDLVVFDELANYVKMLHGQGNGTFQSAISILSLEGRQSAQVLSTRDFDRDGMPDLAMNAGDGLDILVNGGDGSFRAYTLTPGIGNIENYGINSGFESGDFNSDGLTDFAVGFAGSTFGIYLGIPSISVALNQSSSSSPFGQDITLTATVSPSDLLGPVTFYDGANVIGSSLLEGGQAVFTTKTLAGGTHSLRAAYRGTLMGIEAVFSPEADHTVTPGPATSNLRALETMAPGFIPARLAAGDFNQDGKMDLAATDYYFEGTSFTFGGIGDGTFHGPVKHEYGWTGNRFIMRPIIAGDWNHDGNLDLETGTETGSHEYVGFGDGSFQAIRSVPGHPLLADVNRDGMIDRVYADGASVSVLLGLGDRNGKPVHFSTSTAVGATVFEIALGDYNNDGNLDIVAPAREGGFIGILPGNGDGTFQAPVVIAANSQPISPVVADYNSDGKQDLALILQASGTIRILLGEGDGSFQSPIDLAIGGTLTRMIAADLDGDGTLDLAVLSETQDRVLVLPGNGNGSFGSPQLYFTSTYPTDIVAADFNGDGRMDLAIASRNTWLYGRITILLGLNPGPTSISLNISGPSSNLSQGVTMTATVGPSGIAGWVTFYDGATPLGSVQVTAGQAVFTTTLLDSGDHLLSAVFSGDGTNYRSSSSAAQSHRVKALSVYAFGPLVKLHSSDIPPQQADFNGDGIVDLVAVSGGYVTLLLGQGNGQFSASAPYQFGNTPSDMLAADLNHDGKTDVLVNDYNHACLLYLGKGDGTLESPRTIPALAGSSRKLAADFNADGVPDLLDIGYLRVFLNRGDAAIETAIQINPGFTLSYPAVADLNGDGRADIVALNSSMGNAYVLLGKGDGTFLSPVPYPTVSNAGKVAIGDFNGDGIPDLAVSSATSNSVGIMLGLGPGTFENWGDANKGSNYEYILDTCDCDGDGKTDLLAFGSQKVFFLRGLGNGTFQDGIEYTSSTSYVWPQFFTDLNRDGMPDLIMHYTQSEVAVSMAIYPSSVDLAANPSPAKLNEVATLTATLTPADATGTVAFYDDAVLLGKTAIAGGQAVLQTKWLSAGVHKLKARYVGDPLRYVDSVSSNASLTVLAARSGGFGAGTTFATGRGPKGVAAGDLNADGKQDLVIANTTSNTISVLIGNGDGSFATRVSYNTGSAPKTVAIADLDGDEKFDVAVANSASNAVSILSGNGDGTLQAAVNYTAFTSPSSLSIADLNDDQLADLVVASTYGPNVMLGTNGGFSISQISEVLVIGVGASYLNGDASVDIISLGNGYVQARLQQPGWTFSYANPVAVGATPAGLAMGDFNADGKLDLATANTGSNNASVALGNGDGTFQTAVPYATGTGPVAIATTDCNGDGNLDLVVVNGSGNSVTILPGNGDGTFMAGSAIATGGTPAGIAVADFNADGIVDLAVSNSADDTVSLFLGTEPKQGTDFDGDGKPDILWRHASTGENYVWYMDGVTVLSGGVLPTVADQNWKVVGVGDFNSDDQPDILWRHAATGENYVWYLDGVTVLDGGSLPTVADQNWNVVGVADFNNDDKPDILWRHAATGENYVWYLDGLAVLGGGSLPTVTDQNWNVVGVGDFNNDDKPDILWRNVATGDNYVWHLDGVMVQGGGNLPAVADQNWNIVGTADFNSDASPDVLWRHAATGDNYVWYLDGVEVLDGGVLPTVTDTNWAIVP